MSGVFAKPKVVQVAQPEVKPEIVDNTEMVEALEKKRKKRMGAVSQLLSHNNSYGISTRSSGSSDTAGGGKTTLGG